MTYKRTINKFNRGEVDENFLARDDVERIVDTSSRMENMLPIRLGPMPYRPGTQHLGTAQTAESTLTIPFLVSGNDSVELEFFQTSANPSVEGFRVWNDGALLTRTGTADTITNGSFATDLTGWTDGDTGSGASTWFGGAAYLKGDGAGGYARLSQALTVTAAAKRTMRITILTGEAEVLLGTGGVDSGNIFSGKLKRGVHSLTFTPAATPVTITLRSDLAYEVAVSEVAYESAGTFVLSGSFFPDTSTDALVLKTLKHAQSADVMFLWTNGYVLEGRAHPMLMVERRGSESWSLTIPDFEDGPFGLLNTTQLTLAPSATTGDITLEASLPLFMNSTWIGRSYKIVHAAVEGVCIITAITDSTTATARVTVPFGATTASADWYPGRFAEYLPGPTAGALFDGRLWMGGAGNIDGSVSDAYTSFDGSLEGNSKAISKTIGFGPVQQVQWMWAGKNLLIGTEVMEIRVASNDFGDTITQDNCRLVRVSGIGSAGVNPHAVNEVLYIVQRAGTRIFEVSNVTKEDGADVRDLMLLHPDIAVAGIVRIGLTNHPEPRIFAVLADGTVICCLADKSENVIGWTPLSMTNADILDVSVLPDNSEDEVYFVVQRSTTKYIERLSLFSQSVGGLISRHYDSNVYEATPGTSITGLGHLNGEDVYVWADGREYGPYEVSAGAITVPANSWAHSVTGVKHIGYWVSNRLGQYIPASVLSDRKRVTKVGLVMRNVALGTIEYGDGDEMYPIPRVDIDQLSAPNILPQIDGELTGYTTGAGVQDVVRGNGYIYMLVGGDYGGPEAMIIARNDNGLNAVSFDDGATWLLAKNDFGSTTSQIDYGDGLWGASEGDTGDVVYYAADGLSYATSPVGEIGYGLAYGNGVWVWCGDNAGGGNLKTSPDLITWTARTAIANIDWVKAAFADDVFVTICTTAGGTGTFQRSIDDGVTWTATGVVPNGGWIDIAGGNDAFVAVAGTTGMVRSLDNGQTWAAPAVAPTANNWRAVAFGVIGGVPTFVAVASSGTNRVARSVNGGANWAHATNVPPASTWIDVACVNETFVAIGTGICMTSSDGGDTWVSRTLPIAAGQWDQLGVGMIPSRDEDASVFSISTCELVQVGYELTEVPNDELGTTGGGIIVDSVNGHLYASGAVSSQWRLNKFSYQTLQNIAIGVHFVSAVNMTAIFPTITVAVHSMWLDPTGVDFYFERSNVLYHAVLSTPWDFSTATLESSIAIATLATNSGVNYTQFLNGVAVYDGHVYFGTRVGSSGTNYRLARSALGGSGSVSALTTVTELINFTTSQSFSNFTVNPATGKIYVAPTNGTFDIREYVNGVFNAAFSLTGIPGLLTNTVGDLGFDTEGRYLLLIGSVSGNSYLPVAFKSP